MKRHLLAILAVTAGLFGAAAQQRTLIAGLEGDADYRALIEVEGALVRTADSIAGSIATLRGRLRSDTLDRAATSAAIVALERQGFDLRSRMAGIASRINTLEQEWILANLSSPTAGRDVGGELPLPEGDDRGSGGERLRKPAPIDRFASGLTAEQRAELSRAQQAEPRLPRLMADYRLNHTALAALARDYASVATPDRAEDIHIRFDSLAAASLAIAESIASEWEAIFDSKSYLYNLSADKLGHRELLESFSRGMDSLRHERSRFRDSDLPPALVAYALGKRMLVAYEMELAGAMGDEGALDSLRSISKALPGPRDLAELKPVVLTERLFLDYADIAIGGGPYGASNPIPELKVWPRGVIWRVQLGNFSTRQAVSVFRGAHPLAVERSDDGRWRYYAGGFATDSLAAVAVEKLRKAGFRAPVAVVWIDGVAIDPVAAPDDKNYWIAISGTGELTSPIRAAIGTGEVVRGGNLFMVTPLDGASAVRIRTALEALRPTHPGLEIKLSKIAD